MVYMETTNTTTAADYRKAAATARSAGDLTMAARNMRMARIADQFGPDVVTYGADGIVVARIGGNPNAR